MKQLTSAVMFASLLSLLSLLLLLLLLLLLTGCERKYHCIGYRDEMIENRPGESGPPLCRTPDGQFYDASRDLSEQSNQER